jgi:hypothetical protein
MAVALWRATAGFRVDVAPVMRTLTANFSLVPRTRCSVSPAAGPLRCPPASRFVACPIHSSHCSKARSSGRWRPRPGPGLAGEDVPGERSAEVAGGDAPVGIVQDGVRTAVLETEAPDPFREQGDVVGDSRGCPSSLTNIEASRNWLAPRNARFLRQNHVGKRRSGLPVLPSGRQMTNDCDVGCVPRINLDDQQWATIQQLPQCFHPYRNDLLPRHQTEINRLPSLPDQLQTPGVRDQVQNESPSLRL